VAKTVLFFGDSNTRGYGVGPERRYTTLVETTLRASAGDGWEFVTRSALSDFRVIGSKLHEVVEQHRPDVLVWQLPTGPAAYFVSYPWWLRPLRRAYAALFRARKEWSITRQMQRKGGPDADDTRRTVESEGLYLNSVYRWRPAAWPITRHANEILAARYGLITKATRERYLQLVTRHRDRVREVMDGPILFVGFLPHSEHMYPGYDARTTAWSRDLARLLHDPAGASTWVDPYPVLFARSDRYLLSDGCHLTPDGHRVLAGLVAPALAPLLRSCDSPPQARYEVS
jgi:lysophospholipase L1-like esterase